MGSGTVVPDGSGWFDIPHPAGTDQGWKDVPSSIDGSKTGSKFMDAALEHFTAPLNPNNWLDAIKDTLAGAGTGFTDEHFAQAQKLIDASKKNGNILPLLTGKEDNPASEVLGGLTGDAALAGTLGLIAHGLSKLPVSDAVKKFTYADPAKDLINVYSPSDPRFLERAPGAVADIKANAPVKITSNEHLASVSPNEVVTPALQANREIMQQWHGPVQAAGFKAVPASILKATEDSLKSMSDPAKRSALMDESRRQILQEPLTADRLKSLLEEKNGELSGFYSKDESTRDAARQAGADSGKSQALLEAQKKAIANAYYNLLDPKNAGAGPREIQRRYGAIKMLQDEASNGSTRNRILAETSGSPMDKTVGAVKKAALALGESAVGSHFGGPAGLAVGIPEASTILNPFNGKSDPLIARAFRNAPEPTILPKAPPIEQRYPTTGGQLSLPAGPVVQMPGGGSPAVPDASFVRGVPGMNQPPNPARALPEATTRFQGNGSSGEPIGTSRDLPVAPDSSYVKSVPGKFADVMETTGAARDKASIRLMGRAYDRLSSAEKETVDRVLSGKSLRLEDLMRTQKQP